VVLVVLAMLAVLEDKGVSKAMLAVLEEKGVAKAMATVRSNQPCHSGAYLMEESFTYSASSQ
jgi:hypothetical protein